MDSYSVTEAARVIGRSPKRVRQLIAEKKLPTVPDSSPLRIPAEAVHQERESRRNASPSTPGPKPEPERVTIDLDTLMAFADRQTQKAIEAAAADREAVKHAQRVVEETLRGSLVEAQARAQAAEIRAAAAEAEAAVLRERLEAADRVDGVSGGAKKHSTEENPRHELGTKRRRWWR